jgi:hypothetical protein
MKSVRVILTPEAANEYNFLLSKAPESKQEEIILNSFLQSGASKREYPLWPTNCQLY